jgi:hypothetical protein
VLHGKRRTHNMERAVTRTPRLSQGSPAPAARDQAPRSLARRAARDPTAWSGGRGGCRHWRHGGQPDCRVRGLGPDQSPPSRAHHRAETLAAAPKGARPWPRGFPVAACLPQCAIRSCEFAPAGRSVLSSDKADGHRSSGGDARGPHQDGQTTRPQDHETDRQIDR